MTFPSHLTIGFCFAKFNNFDMLTCLIASITPDLIELLLRPIYKYSYKAYLLHRGLSHSVALYITLIAISYHLNEIAFQFFLSVFICHLLPDAFNHAGVPLWNARSKYLTIFGGQVRNYTVWEILTSALICLGLYFARGG